ncbi:DUF4184 family protein [Streptomyces sp. NBC_01198]|uniref:DUF4184 family protein n=1 Tax=Streptomyces sp. NBC_01198 TaxID=2903769 RepID=UPI002E1493DE|nr:DUF4184 family protein [Streptomyces sp. NBC_01198]
MPFTLSHPAAVLPMLRDGRPRGPLVASALVAGSLAPDVPYFTDSLVHGTFGFGVFTHSPLGVVTADVAIAAGLAAGWHWLLREPLVALLPARWADAAEAMTAPTGRTAGLAGAGRFALSAAVGAATHVAWDAFTHGGRLGARLLPVLNRTVLGRPLYYDLQFGSSVLGLGVVGWYVARTLRAVRPQTPPRPRLSARARVAATTLVGAAAAAGAAARLARWDHGPLHSAGILDLIPAVAFGGGAGAAVGLACFAAVARTALGRRRTAV